MELNPKDGGSRFIEKMSFIYKGPDSLLAGQILAGIAPIYSNPATSIEGFQSMTQQLFRISKRQGMEIGKSQLGATLISAGVARPGDHLCLKGNVRLMGGGCRPHQGPLVRPPKPAIGCSFEGAIGPDDAQFTSIHCDSKKVPSNKGVKVYRIVVGLGSFGETDYSLLLEESHPSLITALPTLGPNGEHLFVRNGCPGFNAVFHTLSPGACQIFVDDCGYNMMHCGIYRKGTAKIVFVGDLEVFPREILDEVSHPFSVKVLDPGSVTATTIPASSSLSTFFTTSFKLRNTTCTYREGLGES